MTEGAGTRESGPEHDNDTAEWTGKVWVTSAPLTTACWDPNRPQCPSAPRF